jgi:hypothetical protein
MELFRRALKDKKMGLGIPQINIDTRLQIVFIKAESTKKH